MMILRSKLLSYKCKYYALAQLRMGHIWLQLPESFSFSFLIKGTNMPASRTSNTNM